MLDKLIQYTILAFAFLFPIFFLPITPDSYEFNKMYLLFLTVLILALLLTLKAIQKQKKEIFTSSFLLPLFIVSGLFIISPLFQSVSLISMFITPLSTSTMIAGFLLYVFLIPVLQKDEELPLKIFNLLILAAVITSAWTIAIYSGIFPPNRFTPAGSLLSTAMFLSVIAVYLLFRRPITVITVITFIIIITALSLLVFHLTTDQPPLILPFSFGWQIFLEMLKNLRTLLVGVGPTNFVTAFTLTKPMAINLTNFWNVTFTTSSSFFLTLATEVGVLAGGIYLWILIKFFITPPDSPSDNSPSPPLTVRGGWGALRGVTVVALLLQLLLPGNMTLFILTIILLAIASEKKKFTTFHLENWGIFKYALLAPVFAFLVIVLYFTIPWYLAEVSFKNSLDALLNNRGTDAYNYQREALTLSPNLDRYHLAFSQTNLALANSLAAKGLLSDEDKQNIPRLIQQSIDYARSAVLLNKLNAVNWDNLARTYESLINFAQGSENWAVESYKQKINLDPVSPQNYLRLGRLLNSLKRTDEAIPYLNQAIALKKDLAQPHYLLGTILREKKQNEDAFRELQTALAYLTPDSPDYARVQKELDELAKFLPESVTSATPPQPPENLPQTLESIEATTGALQKLTEPIPSISLDFDSQK